MTRKIPGRQPLRSRFNLRPLASPWIVGLLSLGVACGGSAANTNPDASVGGADDGGLAGRTQCPSIGPTPVEQQLGQCCYHRSNEDRTDNPEFRVAGLLFTKPQSLANAVLASVTANSIDEERLNWLWVLDGVDGTDEIMVRTGAGKRNADGTYSFTSGSGAISWEPTEFQASISGSDWQGGPASDPMAIIIWNADRENVDAELPIRDLTVVRAAMSEDRNCIGRRLLTSYDTSDGELTGFLTLDDAERVFVRFGGTDPIRLCMFLLGQPTGTGECAAIPRANWSFPLDATCDASGCREGGCDPLTTCNAWRVAGGYAAQAVEVR